MGRNNSKYRFFLLTVSTALFFSFVFDLSAHECKVIAALRMIREPKTQIEMIHSRLLHEEVAEKSIPHLVEMLSRFVSDKRLPVSVRRQALGALRAASAHYSVHADLVYYLTLRVAETPAGLEIKDDVREALWDIRHFVAE